jgi:hypothetical protein
MEHTNLHSELFREVGAFRDSDFGDFLANLLLLVLWGRINEKEAAAQLVMKLRATLRSPFDRRPAKGPGQGQQPGEAGEVD